MTINASNQSCLSRAYAASSALEITSFESTSESLNGLGGGGLGGGECGGGGGGLSGGGGGGGGGVQ